MRVQCTEGVPEPPLRIPNPPSSIIKHKKKKSRGRAEERTRTRKGAKQSGAKESTWTWLPHVRSGTNCAQALLMQNNLYKIINFMAQEKWKENKTRHCDVLLMTMIMEKIMIKNKSGQHQVQAKSRWCVGAKKNTGGYL